MDDSLEEWFRRQILAHEAALAHFLARKWTRPEDIQDIRHDIYIRVLEAPAEKRPTSPRGFLLSVARNLWSITRQLTLLGVAATPVPHGQSCRLVS